MKDGSPKERFKIPLLYGSKEKYLTRVMSDPNLTKSISVVVPRISFNLDSISYDASRKQITTIRNFTQNTANTALSKSQYVPVPYNFVFSLSIMTRNTEDGTQILEQILPFFTPDFTATVDFITEMDQKYDIPIILDSVNSSTVYEGEMDNSTRLITWDLNFTVKGYIWPPVKDSNIIRVVNTNMIDMDNNTKLVNIHITPDPINALPEDLWGFSETITEY
jgi:hypothetical protein